MWIPFVDQLWLSKLPPELGAENMLTQWMYLQKYLNCNQQLSACSERKLGPLTEQNITLGKSPLFLSF